MSYCAMDTVSQLILVVYPTVHLAESGLGPEETFSPFGPKEDGSRIIIDTTRV